MDTKIQNPKTKIAAGLLLLTALFAAFFFWASSPVLPPEAYTSAQSYPPAEQSAAVPETLTVMTYNLGYLSGLTNNEAVSTTKTLFDENLEAAVRLLQRVRPDVVAFQEIDLGSSRSYDVQQVDTLAKRLGFPFAATAVNWDEHYVPFPYGLPSVNFGRVLSGQAVLSRFPIRTHGRVVLERMPSPFYYDAFFLDRLAQVIRLDVGGQAVFLINVHLEAFDAATRNRQAEQVRVLFQAYSKQAPTLLVGDFNSPLPRDLPFLPPLPEEGPAQDRATALIMEEQNLREAFDGLYPDTLATPGSYPSDTPVYRIDHLFYDTAHFTSVEAYVVDGPDQPSDHRAVVARFVLK